MVFKLDSNFQFFYKIGFETGSELDRVVLIKNGFALVMKLVWVVGVVSGKKLIGNLLEIIKWKLGIIGTQLIS